MPAPKSVTKIKTKNGNVSVEYTTDVDAAAYYMHELTRAALRDVGKYVAKVYRTAYYSHFRKRTGEGGKAVKYKVCKAKPTEGAHAEVGYSAKAKGFYAAFQETGTSKQPQLALLTHAAEDNVAEIVKIESQYLSGLSDEAVRLAQMVNEDDMEGDADD